MYGDLYFKEVWSLNEKKKLQEVVLNLLVILRYSFCLELLVESIKAGNFFPCRNIFQLPLYILLNNLTFIPFKSDAIMNTIQENF